MPGPTTEFLSGQIDQIRNDISVLGKVVQEARREAIDGLRDLGDTFVGQLGDIREHVGGELTRLRQEVGAGREALKMEQPLIREDLARFQVQTEKLFARFDRANGFSKALIIALVGVPITVIGGEPSSSGMPLGFTMSWRTTAAGSKRLRGRTWAGLDCSSRSTGSRRPSTPACRLPPGSPMHFQ